MRKDGGFSSRLGNCHLSLIFMFMDQPEITAIPDVFFGIKTPSPETAMAKYLLIVRLKQGEQHA